MIQSLKSFFIPLFFLVVGTMFTLQTILWETHNVAWMTILVTFVMVPILDSIIGKGTSPNLGSFGKFSLWVPRFYFVLHFFVIFFYLFRIEIYSYQEIPLFGLALGTITGAVGITVAHELMHSKSKFDRFSSKLILCSVCYGHFFVEHLRGHHVRVATPNDCATAKKNQSLYSFLLQSILGSFFHAWQLEKMRLEVKKHYVFTLRNQVILFHVFSFLLILFIYLSFGAKGVLVFLIQSIWAIILLETTNYIEHYGLIRGSNDTGGFIPVGYDHSWNSNHLFSNWILLHLPWHADHHKNMNRPFNQLKPINQSPQLPYGYPTMIIMAFLPPIFISIMNNILVRHNFDE